MDNDIVITLVTYMLGGCSQQVDIGGDISSATEETSPKQQHREKERKTHDDNYINDDKNGNGDKSQHAEILHKSCKVNINGQQEI